MSNENNSSLINEQGTDSKTIKYQVGFYVLSKYKGNRSVAVKVKDIYDITEYPKSFKQAMFDIYLACRFNGIFDRLFEAANNDKTKFESLLNDFRSIAFLKALYPSSKEGSLTTEQEIKLREIRDKLPQINDAAVNSISFEENSYLKSRKLKSAIVGVVSFAISTKDIGRTVTSDLNVVKDAQKVGMGIEEIEQEKDK